MATPFRKKIEIIFSNKRKVSLTSLPLGPLRLLVARVTLPAKRSSKQRANQLMKHVFTTNICYRRYDHKTNQRKPPQITTRMWDDR